MRFTNAQYLEKEVVTVSCRNNNATLAILDGQPVFYQSVALATNFGVDVSLASDASFSGYGLFAGIAKWSKLAGTATTITGAQVGDVFEAVAYGFTDAIIIRRTRSATTDSWGTMGALSANQQLDLDGAGNFLGLDNTVQAAVALPPVVLAESAASAAGTGSGTTNMVGLQWTQRMKVFVRTM